LDGCGNDDNRKLLQSYARGGEMKKNIEKFELATIEKMTDVEIYTGDYLDTLTEEIREAVRNHKPDLSTDASRKKTKSFANNIAKAKVRADDAGKALNAERNEVNEKVNARRRQLRDDFDEQRDLAKKLVVEYEEAEAAKEEAERQKVIDELDRIERERVADIERREAELAAKELKVELAEEQRLAKEAFAKSEQERIEREADIKRQAEEQAVKDAQEAIDRAEREKQDAIDKAESDRLQAIEDARLAEIRVAQDAERTKLLAEQQTERRVQAERDRIAYEKVVEEKATEKREADKKHKERVNREVLSAMVKSSPITKEEATVVISAISNGLIPHVKISY
jgi:hypothetical protein